MAQTSDYCSDAALMQFGFTGRERDVETGLYYYRARYYDPKVGKFLSEDPIGFAAGDANLSRYVENQPTRYTDPSGMEWQDDSAWWWANPWAYNGVGQRSLMTWAFTDAGKVEDRAIELARRERADIAARMMRDPMNADLDRYRKSRFASDAEVGRMKRYYETGVAAQATILGGGILKPSAAAKGSARICPPTELAARRSNTPSPALPKSPYHPDAVQARVRPSYKSNPPHLKGPQFNPRKTPEPGDAAQVFQSAVRGDMKTWYGVGADGVYRYFSDNAGSAHFSAIVDARTLPRALREQLGL